MVEVLLDPPVSTLMASLSHPQCFNRTQPCCHPLPSRPTFPELPNSQEIVQCCTELQTEKNMSSDLLVHTRKADNGGVPVQGAQSGLWETGGGGESQTSTSTSTGEGVMVLEPGISIFHHKRISIKHISEWGGNIGTGHAGQKKNHPENLSRLNRVYESFSLKTPSMSFDSLLSPPNCFWQFWVFQQN